MVSLSLKTDSSQAYLQATPGVCVSHCISNSGVDWRLGPFANVLTGRSVHVFQYLGTLESSDALWCLWQLLVVRTKAPPSFSSPLAPL